VLAGYGAGEQPRTLLVDPNARVIAFPLSHAIVGTAVAEATSPRRTTEPVLIAAQAPVLAIPDVLSPADCRMLMDLWERENIETGVATEQSGVGGQEIDHSYKNRRDHQIADPDIIRLVNDRLARRIVPEVKKAFNYEITRFEHLRIGAYDAGAGYFRAHRDNTKPATAHRKFALTLCLNDEYEGGYLNFPEYGKQLYRPPAGGAVVFSTSLLHEVTDVTGGQRFTLITFFFGEQEYRERIARYEKARAAGRGTEFDGM
jgi:predicted 2-oxoglutarate/Fe(II)-dependent dioxygenase YbiX